MASSTDFVKLWADYQELVKTQDVSIVDYVQRNGVVYAQFERWFRKHIGGVSIIPVEEYPSGHSASPSPSSPPVASKPAKVHYVCIELSNGLRLCQKCIDYNRLRLLVENLESLC